MKHDRAFGERLLRATLRFHPPSFRRAYGEEMLEYYRETCLRERAGRGGLWQVRFLSTSIAAAIREGWRQRRRDEPQERTPMAGFGTDLRHALRRVAARPLSSALAAGMLALAVGVTTAMFTVVDALLIRPVPFPDASRIGRVAMRSDHTVWGNVAPGVLKAWRESGLFENLEGAHNATSVIETDSLIARESAFATPGLLRMLGVRPVVGRLFHNEEGRAGSEDLVLLSERLWRRAFGGAASVVGTRIMVDGRPLLVVGVLPDTFRFPVWNTELWRPIDYAALPPSLSASRPAVYARFAWTIPEDEALRRATRFALDADPVLSKSGDGESRASKQKLAGLNRGSYLTNATPFLAGGVVLVFLVLCANVCSLLLAQMGGRTREFRMCAALGASRFRLLRQALTESLVLGGCGVGAGIGVAWLLVWLTRSWLPNAFLLQTLNTIDLDARALAAAAASGAAAAMAAGLLPAWVGTRVGTPGSGLHAEPRGATESRSVRAFTRGLLVSEIALGSTLLLGTALLVASFVKLAAVDRGLDTSGVVTAWLSLTPATPSQGATGSSAVTALDEMLRALPGVTNLVISRSAPPGGGAIHFGDDWISDAPGAHPLNLAVSSYEVDRDFFDLYRIRLLRGRTFDRGEDRTHVIVGQRLADLMWPGLDPVGRSFHYDKTRYEVIGLVNELRYPSLDAFADRPEFYYRGVPTGGGMYASLRCQAACPDLAVIRQKILALSQVRRLFQLNRLEDAYLEELARPRAAAILAVLFAAIAVLAAAGGLFSVLSYAVGRRRREFGIRVSLGARPVELRRLVLGEGVRLAAIGVAIGGLCAWVLARALASVVYDVTPTEPLVWTTVIAVIALTTMAASWIPARRAAGVDPVELLRDQ